jgi:hypothetical protein
MMVIILSRSKYCNVHSQGSDNTPLKYAETNLGHFSGDGIQWHAIYGQTDVSVKRCTQALSAHLLY